jgi:Transposase IS66 family
MSNNLAENAIRPVALKRKNWIYVGSKEAGPRVAAIISVVATCRRLKRESGSRQQAVELWWDENDNAKSLDRVGSFRYYHQPKAGFVGLSPGFFVLAR